MGTETSSIVVLIIMIVLSCSATAKSQGRSPVRLEVQPSQSIRESSDGVYLVDFERVAFGNLMVTPPATGGRNEVTFRFGEALENNRVNATPPGSVRFAEVKVQLDAGVTKIVAPPPDARNTKPPAVLSPVAFGTLLPFRWVEVQGWPGKLQPLQIVRRAAFDATWKDEDASFHSADPMLDRVWDLCHYSIKATSFAGVFVDGDRERLAYEADAYLNQMGYYASDANSAMPRATFDRLVRFPTWPSEWAPHMVFMALADWMETGDRVWLAKHYEFLKSKLLTDRVGPDGLVRSTPALIKKGPR
jgi:alpha-L-rhamnosidase